MDLDSPRFVFGKNIQEWIRIILLFQEFLRATQFFFVKRNATLLCRMFQAFL